MNARDLLFKAAQAVDAADLADTSAVIQYNISTPVHHRFEGGALTAHDGEADEPDVIVTVSDEDLIRMFTGEMKPVAAVFSGRMKVRGDLLLAQKLLGLINRDKIRNLLG
jgi:putative sterol carrier protein